MGLTVDKKDSPQAERIINAGKEITKLVRETVYADRHSRNCATGAHPNRWTDAARKRDDAVKFLKERLQQIAEEI